MRALLADVLKWLVSARMDDSDLPLRDLVMQLLCLAQSIALDHFEAVVHQLGDQVFDFLHGILITTFEFV